MKLQGVKPNTTIGLKLGAFLFKTYMGNLNRPPVKYIIQIDNMYLADVMFYWTYYEQPCSLLFVPPNTAGLTAIKLVVDNDEAANFMMRLREKTGCKFYIVDK